MVFIIVNPIYHLPPSKSAKVHQLIDLLKELHLPMFREYHQEFAQKAIADELGYEEYLYELAQRECEVRRANKIDRLIKTSKLPLEKTLQTFEMERMPLKIRRQIKVLSEGSFADQGEICPCLWTCSLTDPQICTGGYGNCTLSLAG
jgi:DNA replication protein DnaC